MSITGVGSARNNGRVWLKQYPEGVPADVDVTKYGSLIEMLEEAFEKFNDRKAFICTGKSITYGDLEEMSRALAGFLQSAGVRKGARVALMMPNLLQYPISVAAVLRAGYIVVNVVPLGTPRELHYQLEDSGATILIVDESFVSTVRQVISDTSIKRVILTSMGDPLRVGENVLSLVEFGAIKKFSHSLPGLISFHDAMLIGRKIRYVRPKLTSGDVAFIQYSFGRLKGTSKGATTLHRNVVASALQCEAWIQPTLRNSPLADPVLTACALPFHQLSALTMCFLVSMRAGGVGLLIQDPRESASVVNELRKYQVNVFPTTNTLCTALLHTPGFDQIDFSRLRISFGGGGATQFRTADAWFEKTGCVLCEAYVLAGTLLPVTCNPIDVDSADRSSGLPLPSTLISIRDREGNEAPIGQVGEIYVKGPQVMSGHWYGHDASAMVITDDGYVRTGDIGLMKPDGFIRKI